MAVIILDINIIYQLRGTIYRSRCLLKFLVASWFGFASWIIGVFWSIVGVFWSIWPWPRLWIWWLSFVIVVQDSCVPCIKPEAKDGTVPRDILERDNSSVLLENFLANEQAYAVRVKVSILWVLRQLGIFTFVIDGDFRGVESIEHIVEVVKVLLFHPSGSVLYLEIDLLLVRIVPHNDVDPALESIVYSVLNERWSALNESGLVWNDHLGDVVGLVNSKVID